MPRTPIKVTKSPTGRLVTMSEPEIQNLPGTPAYYLEMFRAKFGCVTGRFSAEKPSFDEVPKATNYRGYTVDIIILDDIEPNVRTGLFRTINYRDLDEYQKRGWLVVDARYGLGHYDNMLLWHCECGEVDPWQPQSKPEPSST